MKLWLNDREAALVRVALHMERVNMAPAQQEMVDKILVRMDKCAIYQKTKRRTRNDSRNHS